MFLLRRYRMILCQLSFSFFVLFALLSLQYVAGDRPTDWNAVESDSTSRRQDSSPYLQKLANAQHAQRPVKRLQAARMLVSVTQRSASKSMQVDELEVAKFPPAVPALANGSTRRAPTTDAAAAEDGGRLTRLKRRKSETKLSDVLDDSGSTMVPLSELDIKSDAELQKLFYRTTAKMMDYTRLVKTTPLPSTVSVIPTIVLSSTPPSLFGALFGGGAAPQTVTLPSLITAPPAVPSPSPAIGSPSADVPRPPSLRPNVSTEQFEQLGCGWDLLTQSCKDVFQLGWCQQCVDFGNVFLHDCKCAAVTPFYASALAALNNAAAAAAAANNRSAVLSQSPHVQATQLPSFGQSAQLQQLNALPQPQSQQQSQQQQPPILFVPVPIPVSMTTPQQNPQQSQGVPTHQQPQGHGLHNQPILGQPQAQLQAQPQSNPPTFPAAGGVDFSQALAEAQRQAFINAIQQQQQQQQQLQQQQIAAAQSLFAAQSQAPSLPQPQPGGLAPTFHNSLQPFPAGALAASASPATMLQFIA